MNEEDPRLIVTLEAVNPTAERAWNRTQNQDRCLPASESVVDISSRESTPAVPQPKSQVRLTFDNKPKDLAKGFVFGSDTRICDIFLGERGAGFSVQQFCITFNERGEVIFKNTSRKKAQVDYHGEDPPRRNYFTWILFNKYDNITVTLGKDDLVFKIKWPDHKIHRAEYEAHCNAYFKERRMPTTQHSPRQEPHGQEPIYLLEEEIGQGSSGTVYKAVDVSTGDVYAAKKFDDSDWKKEVDILMTLSHEHIVKFVGFSEEQKPLLVMEYLPLGNLADQADQDFITKEEILQVLCQVLQVLVYLQSHTPHVAHRDIKPENILIHSLKPFAIKLADFGYAKHDRGLKTFCGTDEYAAPEIWGRKNHSAAVDIWSLGVVVLEYVYGLPEPSQDYKGMLWCQDIVQTVKEAEGKGDALMDFISTKMLKMNYLYRGSASDCLEEFYRLRFDQIPIVDSGQTTSRGKTAGQVNVTRTTSVSFEAAGDPFKPSNRRISEQESELNKRDISTNSKGHNPAAQPRQIPELDLSKGPLATDVACLSQGSRAITPEESEAAAGLLSLMRGPRG